MLEDIKNEYVYPAHDAYFSYMTRGCGMRCEFCAVQTLEPKYVPYLSISESIHKIENEYGPKRDLLLMDNNVLRSPDFDKIIDEIIELGFGRGATYKNPNTGKTVQRFVDFNQGLDAFLMTSEKARRLGELAIRPARIAFDHIEDKAKYVDAVRLCAENGITHMSNYLLYNSENFTGKGNAYRADTPKDLFERMEISMNLQDELTIEMGHNVAIFSFPMRYIPLDEIKRGYVGSGWNKLYLRSLQRMLIPTQGKGVSSRSFFEADFGKNANEFEDFLAMPEELLSIRGHFVKRKDENRKEQRERYVLWEENKELIAEWIQRYRALGTLKNDFIEVVKECAVSCKQYLWIQNEQLKKLYLFYFTKPGLLKLFGEVGEDDGNFVRAFIVEEFPLLYKRLLRYICTSKIPYSYLTGLIKVFGKQIFCDILNNVDLDDVIGQNVIDGLGKAQRKANVKHFDCDLVKYYVLYKTAGVFDKSHSTRMGNKIRKLDEPTIRKMLIDKLPELKEALLLANKEEMAHDFIVAQIEDNLKVLREQLSLLQQ
jgi:hypothetical protein